MATKEKKLQTLKNGLAIALVISLSLNAILIIKRTEIFPTKKELYSENKDLNQKVVQYSNELNKYKGISQKLDQVIENSRKKIDAKEKQIANLLRDRNRTEQENKELLSQLDSLHEENLHLIDSLLVERQEQDVINNKIEDLENIIDGLNKKIGIAENLIADEIKITPKKKNVFGNLTPTVMAKKVEEIEVCFDILENRIAKSGTKDLYFVITSPYAEVITDGSLENEPTFQHPDHNKQAKYSKNKSVNYDQEKLNVCSTINLDKSLREGLYIIEIFSNENKMGMTTFTLQ